jgi:hypothetical protein
MPQWPPIPIGSPRPVQEDPVGDDMLLKVCPICQQPHSKGDQECRRCTRKAKRIERILRAHEIQDKRDADEAVSKDEEAFLERNRKLLDEQVSPEDLKFLEKAPFQLGEQPVAVRPSFENRLLFFMDRMREVGRSVHSTQSAARLFTEYGQKQPIGKREFVTFAIDHGVKPLMSADWDNLYAAWDTQDILKLFKEFTAEQTARRLTEPGKTLSSLEAAVASGITGAKSFVDFARSQGIEPANKFGERPEQMVWRAEDVEKLRITFRLHKEIEQLEEVERRLVQMIERLNEPPVKWPAMQKMREKSKELEGVRAMLTAKRRELENAAPPPAAPEPSEVQKAEEAEGRTASDMRLTRILAFRPDPKSPTAMP